VTIWDGHLEWSNKRSSAGAGGHFRNSTETRGGPRSSIVLWLVWLEELPLLLGDPPTVSVARGYTRGKMRGCLACHRPRVLYTCGATGHQTTKQQPHQLILRQYEPNPKAKTPTRNVFNRVCAILERVILPQTRNPH